MLSILTDTEKAVVETMTKGLLPEPALRFLEDVGHKMSRATYFRHKKKIEETKLERMQFIATHFQELHLEKIDRLELIDKLMWEQFEKEQQPSKKVKILESIANLQPFVMSSYESSSYAIEVTKRFNPKKSKDELMTFDEWFTSSISAKAYRIGNESDEDNGKYYRNLREKYDLYVEDWNWHQGFSALETDPCKSKAWTTAKPRPSIEDAESQAWADAESEPEAKPKSLITLPLISTQNNQPTVSSDITNTKTEEQRIIEPEPEPEEDKPLLYNCPFDNCSNSFETYEELAKHKESVHVLRSARRN